MVAYIFLIVRIWASWSQRPFIMGDTEDKFILLLSTQCTELFKMIVVVLTTCHTQYTWDSSICIFLFNRTTLQAPIRYVTKTWSVVLLNKKKYIHCYLKCIVYDKLLKPWQSFRITLYIMQFYMTMSVKLWCIKPHNSEYFHFILVGSLMMAMLCDRNM